jgi:hypothetical protein
VDGPPEPRVIAAGGACVPADSVAAGSEEEVSEVAGSVVAAVSDDKVQVNANVKKLQIRQDPRSPPCLRRDNSRPSPSIRQDNSLTKSTLRIRGRDFRTSPLTGGHRVRISADQQLVRLYKPVVKTTKRKNLEESVCRTLIGTISFSLLPWMIMTALALIMSLASCNRPENTT